MGEKAPFVLLDDARDGGAGARIYADPVEIVTASRILDVPDAMRRIREATRDGLHAAGFLSYDAGAAFVAKTPASDAGPLLWFGLFNGWRPFDPASLPDPHGAWIGAAQPDTDFFRYAAQLDEVLALIRAGDIYQANLTFSAHAWISGDPLALYAKLRAASRAGWGAVVDTGNTTYLSLSPELFFSLEKGRLTARPMKGTAPRDPDPLADAAAARALAADPKQRAENLMIVDLMRNDLSRIARPGSVRVPALFTVESYPTVHQMTSTVTAEITPDADAVDVIAALFPCGSITGAPKLRAMQAIHPIEERPRGIYTGSIGYIARDGDAQFNVAIRTLTIDRGASQVHLGLGSGIVADSVAHAEWAECLAKGAFLTAGNRPFDLIETMRFDPQDGIFLLDLHLARMKASAAHFGLSFDRHAARNELQAATFRLRDEARIRLLLSPTGAIAIETAPLPPPLPAPVAVRVVPLPVSPDDFRLRHKTTDRAFYDDARRSAETVEVAFVDRQGFLTEGSFTNLFVERDGQLLTPPIDRGLLPGVLRAELLDSGRAVEQDLTPADLTNGFFVGNALRGLVAAVTVAATASPGI